MVEILYNVLLYIFSWISTQNLFDGSLKSAVVGVFIP